MLDQKRFQKALDEYLAHHYDPQFDDIPTKSKYPSERKDWRLPITYAKRLYTALSAFDPYFKPGMTILDIGCYPGTLIKLLRIIYGDNFKMYGVGLKMPDEFTKLMSGKYHVQLKQFFGDRYIMWEEAETLKDVPKKIDLPDGSVDFIFFMEVIEHLLSPLPTLEEVKRLLAPGGKVFITTPNIASPINALSMILHGTSPNHTGEDIKSMQGNFWFQTSLYRPHVNIYSYRQMKELMKYYDFKTIFLEGYDDHHDDFIVFSKTYGLVRKAFRVLENTLRPVAKHFGPSIKILAEKK